MSSADALVIPMPTFILLPDTFDAVIPMTTVVVEDGTTYTLVVVIPTLAFVFSLKVFAICDYPNAIARATTSSSDAPPPPPPPPPEAFTTVIPVAPTVAVILLLKLSVVAIPAAVPLF